MSRSDTKTIVLGAVVGGLLGALLGGLMASRSETAEGRRRPSAAEATTIGMTMLTLARQMIDAFS